MSITGQKVWAFRCGMHYEGSVLAGVFATLDSACLAAQEFMEKEDAKDKELGLNASPWEYDDSDGYYWWDNKTYWVLVKEYEIQ